MKTELKHSENFIHQKVDKKTGFTVSSNYFEELEDAINIRLFEENNKKETGFTYPTKYFDTLEENILNKVITKKKTVKIKTLQQRVLQIVPWAAAAVITIYLGLYNFSFQQKNLISLEGISDEDIENWLETQTIDSDEIATYFTEMEAIDTNFAFTNISNLHIEEYLYNTHNDTSILNEFYDD